MPAYAVAHLRKLNINRELVLYLKKIDENLQPFRGRFLVHGKKGETVEGAFSGQVVVIEFPGLEQARNWYHSKAYQKILSLRTNNCEGSVVLVDGVPDSYKATDLISKNP